MNEIEAVQDIKEYKNDYFKSKEKEFLFYLTKLEGKQRNKLLGITDEHYADKKLAKEWYKNLSKLVHPDMGGTDEAFNTLQKLYNIMVEDEV